MGAQAQGLWNAIQGKPKDDAAARAAADRERREDAAAEAEVGASSYSHCSKAWDYHFWLPGTF